MYIKGLLHFSKLHLFQSINHCQFTSMGFFKIFVPSSFSRGYGEDCVAFHTPTEFQGSEKQVFAI